MRKNWIFILMAVYMLSADMSIDARESVGPASKLTDMKYIENTNQIFGANPTGSDYITSTDEKWKYKLQENEAYIYRYLGKTENLEIPEEIDGYTVGGILGTALFIDDYTTKTLSLPDTIHTIEAGAFAAAYALESITMNQGATEGFHSRDGVLYNGNQLIAYPPAKEGETYVIPEGTNELLRGAFYGCSNLTKIVVPGSVGWIGISAFVRSKQPIDIVLKRESFTTLYIERSCWEMAKGTKFLVKSESLKNKILSEINQTDTVPIEVVNPVPATSLRFKDGSVENHISISYTNTGRINVPLNIFELNGLYQQEPADTTDNVNWSLLSADKSKVSGQAVCKVSSDGVVQTYSGGKAVLVGKDESGHEIILNVTIYGEIEAEKEEVTDTPQAEEEKTDSMEEIRSENHAPATTDASVNNPPVENIASNIPSYVTDPKNPVVENIPAIEDIIVSLKKGKIKVSWKRNKNLTGYQIQYARNRKFSKGKKTITIKKNRKNTRVLHKLKAKKKYYLRVRGYKILQGKRCYGDWSRVMAIRADKYR